MTVAVRSLGSVPFDGLTLPLTSPGGRFLAAQHGPTPGWPAILAEPTPEGSQVPVQLRISAYALASNPANSLTPIHWPRPLPRGLLLGRSCDDAGFLVESTRAPSEASGQSIEGPAARWIGKVDWLSGELAWLVGPTDPGAIACFASFGPSGELAFCRAAAPGKPFDLVVRTDPADAATESILHAPPNATLACPTFSADRARVYVFLIANDPGARLTLLAVDLGAPGSANDLSIVARAELNVSPSIPAAFQSVLALQTPWPLNPHVGPASFLESGLAFVSLETGSMAWFDPRTSTILPLARGTLGAAPLNSASPAGLFLGAARELVYQPLLPRADSSLGPETFGPEAAVLAGAFLPRLTSGGVAGQARFILLSPPLPDASALIGVFELSPIAAP